MHTQFPEGAFIELDTDVSWNVMTEHEFKERVHNVFSKVAEVLTRTLGPYGATTIIAQVAQTHITKDGWSVLKKITFNNQTENNILRMLHEISAQVVSKVGDGSTSSIVSANEVLRVIQEDDVLKTIRPKELVDTLLTVSSIISEEISRRSIKIEKGDSESIYRLAKVSTNDSELLSRIIADIYEQTGNPTIDFRKSDAPKTYSEIVQGYKTNIRLLDRIYATTNEGTCKVANPMFLLFDHRLTIDHYNHFVTPYITELSARNSQSRVVVVAPAYDNALAQMIKEHTMRTVSNGEMTREVCTTVGLFNKDATVDFHDFAMLTGATIFTEDATEKKLREFFKCQAQQEQELPEGVEPLEYTPFNLHEYAGQTEMAELSDSATRVDGFVKRNEHRYEAHRREAQANYDRVLKNQMELNIVNTEIYTAKKRIAKLECRMGMIHVGGRSTLEREGIYDTVEDAVRAAQTAYQHGYNIGGNLIIPVSIDALIADTANEFSDLELRVMKLLRSAFTAVFGHVIRNKEGRTISATNTSEAVEKMITDITEEAIAKETCYDLNTETFNKNIINPSLTDIEILKGTTSIVSLLVGSNQYLSIQAESKF